MRITSTTTLAELAIERASLGIVFLSINSTRNTNAFVACVVSDDGAPMYFGHGMTEHDAIDDAFQQRRSCLAQRLAQERRDDVPPGM